MKKKLNLIVAASLLFLGACGSTNQEIGEETPESLYLKGYEAFQKKEYDSSAKYFDAVEQQHPYSIWSGRSQIMAAYAFYQQNKYDDAILALDRFIQLHPGNRNTPYAYYLKGLCYYEQISDIERDQKMTEMALHTFQELLARFPGSVYKDDAVQKITLIYGFLAGQDLSIGRYYLQREDIIPAMNRAQNVIIEYPRTGQVPEAYYRLAAGYVSLGMVPEAKTLAGVLTTYYPDSRWTEKTSSLVKKYDKEK
ncbi:MAG: outer membrane protein assembly factor BamD [Lactobacillales bacterium]|jgi:outer membrane protein assembly factor BamD|nr:outer membrane protein assembly factor BamD [Lactobacillales bacterium]